MNISLYKREYLRGIIDGQTIKLPKDYDMYLLNKIYKRYIKLNPKVINQTKQKNDNIKN